MMYVIWGLVGAVLGFALQQEFYSTAFGAMLGIAWARMSGLRRDIDLAPFRTAPVPIGSRAFNTHLLKLFADELKVPAGEPTLAAGAFETETGSDAGTFRTGDNAGRFN